MTEYGNDLTVTVKRNAERITFHMTPRVMEGADHPRMGIKTEFFRHTNEIEKKDIGLFEALRLISP